MEFVGSTFHIFGIGVGESIFRQNSVHLRVVLSLLSQDVHHFSARTLSVIRPIHNFHNGFVARLSAVEQIARNENVSTDLSFSEQETIAVVFHVKTSHKGVFCAANNLHHFCFSRVTATTRHHRHAHHITIKRMMRIEFRHEEFFSAIVGHKHIVSVALATKNPFNELRCAFSMTIIPFLIGGEKIV